MAKHRLDRTRKEGWGGPALVAMCQSDTPATHSAHDTRKPGQIVPDGRNDLTGPAASPSESAAG